jgi:hypothetical protein
VISFPKFDEWIVDVISDDKRKRSNITMEEIELSQSLNLWAWCFSGMWAYGSHLRDGRKGQRKGKL